LITIRLLCSGCYEQARIRNTRSDVVASLGPQLFLIYIYIILKYILLTRYRECRNIGGMLNKDALKLLEDCEKGLRRLVSSAVATGDYVSVMRLTSWARVIAGLAEDAKLE